jgi:hypothetical protein
LIRPSLKFFFEEVSVDGQNAVWRVFYGKRFSGRVEISLANWLRKRNEAKWKNNGKELEGNAKSSEMEMKQMSNE